MTSKRGRISLLDKKGCRRNVTCFRIGPPRFWVGTSFDYYEVDPAKGCPRVGFALRLSRYITAEASLAPRTDHDLEKTQTRAIFERDAL